MNNLSNQIQHTVEHAEFWENLYRARNTPWDINQSSPPLKSFLQSPYAPPPGKIAALGCGTGHDCLLFASHGFLVLGVDFAPSAIAATQAKFEQHGLAGTTGYVLQRDIFQLYEYFGAFDYVLEHTCFCAIDPSRRRTYSYTVRDLLKPGGKFIALWWLLDRGSAGPPFSVSKADIFSLFDSAFHIDLAIEPTNSIAARQGQELLTIMTKK